MKLFNKMDVGRRQPSTFVISRAPSACKVVSRSQLRHAEGRALGLPWVRHAFLPLVGEDYCVTSQKDRLRTRLGPIKSEGPTVHS